MDVINDFSEFELGDFERVAASQVFDDLLDLDAIPTQQLVKTQENNRYGNPEFVIAHVDISPEPKLVAWFSPQLGVYMR